MTGNFLGNRGGQLEILDVGPFLYKPVLRVVPPPRAGLISLVTNSWWKGRRFTENEFPGNKGQRPDPHSP